MTITRHLAIGVAASALLFAAQSAHAVPNPGTIEGVVKNAAGQPVSGAYVKLKNTDGRLTFLVASQAGGKFTAGDLPPGSTRSKASAAASRAPSPHPLTVDANKTAKAADITLVHQAGSGSRRRVAGPFAGRRTRESIARASRGRRQSARRGEVHDLPQRQPHRLETLRRRRLGVHHQADAHQLGGWGLARSHRAGSATITKYLADNFKPLSGHDENARMPRTLPPATTRSSASSPTICRAPIRSRMTSPSIRRALRGRPSARAS